MLWALTAAIVLAAIIWFLYWLFYLRFHAYTDDAYANGNMVNLNSAVSGSVISFYADDTDLVLEGQLLVKLDPTKYQVAFDKEMATLAERVLEVKQLYGTVEVRRAELESKRVALERAQYDFDNRSRLVTTQAISNEDFTHSKDDFLFAQAQHKQAEENLKVAQDAAGNTPWDEHPLLIEQKESVKTAYYNLKHCSIYAPTTGYVAQRAVEVGQWAEPSTNLLAIIPTNYVWVDANFKETQLTWMRIGQPATVWLDIYGSRVQYPGKVLGIASGTGSVFSIIPPQNATGNWIKIVQRLPVRISLDPEVVKKYPTRLGLSAEVDVDITNTDLPMLVPKATPKVVGRTNVFDISMETVDAQIDAVIHGE